MNYIYEQRYGFEIVPVYDRRNPTGFQILNSLTREKVAEFDNLCQAEKYISTQGNGFGKRIVAGSAAELKGY